MLVTPWAKPLMHKALPRPELVSEAPEDVALSRRLIQASPVPVTGDDGPAFHLPLFRPKEHRIGIPQGKYVAPEVMAHEMGHALNHRSLLGKAVQNPFAAAGYYTAPIMGIGYGLLPEEDMSTPAAMAATTATTIPLLASEAAASIRADHLMKEHGATAKQLSKGRKNLAKAFGTYLVLPAAAAMEPVAVRAGKQLLEDARE